MPGPPAPAPAPPPPGPPRRTAGVDPVYWLRVVGRLEAISWLVLLGVAMPLKYAAGRPAAVSVIGMLHGLLFLAFVAVWLLCLRRLPARWALLSLTATVVPAGPFWTDPKLRRFERGPGSSGGGAAV